MHDSVQMCIVENTVDIIPRYLNALESRSALHIDLTENVLVAEQFRYIDKYRKGYRYEKSKIGRGLRWNKLLRMAGPDKWNNCGGGHE